ncbi:unnamed protein product [Adineta ricciae]|uniref:Uncharacterized protein n=1 Tax=Adineta ricciae TaxID=249248 RepID=A0A815WVC1_ADIRI|nr:unnamed protein product [Adineta ricciae]CAF1606381.1 unnamed protein product [Adineta ricciae]
MSTTVNTITDEQVAEVHVSDENKSNLLSSERSLMGFVFGVRECVLGTYSCSADTHSSNPIIGICSRNILPKPAELLRGSYGVDRSTYGWEKDLRSCS